MGEQRNRFVRSNPQRSQLLSAVLSGGAVAAVAVAFAVAGVDDVEVLATLFFAPVFVATLLGGRNVGYGAAAAATLGYLALRFGDIGDSGAMRVAVLVTARAACYAVVAQATPSFRQRFLGVPASASFADEGDGRMAESDASPVHAPSLDAVAAGGDGWGEEPAGNEWPDPVPAYAGVAAAADEPEPVPVAAGWTEPPPVEAGWGPAGEGGPWGTPDAPPWGPPDEGMGWEAPPAEPVWDPPGAEPAWNGSGAATTWDDPPPAPESSPAAPDWAATAASTWDPPTAEPMPDPWADPQEPSAAPDRFLAPPAPTVPTGWVDDATVPLGDETIPLGYTGELFLPRDLRQPSPPGPPGTPRNGSTNGGPHHLPYDPSATTPGRETRAEQPGQSVGGGNSDPWVDEAWTDEPPSSPPPPQPMPSPAPFDRQPASTPSGPVAASGGVDPETRLWNARSFRERLTTARDESRQSGSPFSVVMIQVADQPFQTLPYRRQVAVLRELGHQFIQARMIDHLVHLPDGAQHWFAVVLPDADRGQAHQLERRLRSAIASYLRSRGLQLGEVQSASLTSPDDDQAMGSIWASLLGPTSVS